MSFTGMVQTYPNFTCCFQNGEWGWWQLGRCIRKEQMAAPVRSEPTHIGVTMLSGASLPPLDREALVGAAASSLSVTVHVTLLQRLSSSAWAPAYQLSTKMLLAVLRHRGLLAYCWPSVLSLLKGSGTTDTRIQIVSFIGCQAINNDKGLPQHA